MKNVRARLVALAIFASTLNALTATGIAFADPSQGSIDSSFGIGGVVTTTVGNSNVIFSVAIDGSGRIVTGGDSSNGGSQRMTLARDTSDGVLDSTFGTGGRSIPSIGSGSSNAASIAIDSNGKIVAGGNSFNGSNGIFTLARFTSTGALDSTFGTGGVETSTIGNGGSLINSIAIDNNGRILAGGNSLINGHGIFTLARYTSAGVLDNTFGTGGVVTTQIGSSYSMINSVAVDSTGNIIVGGYSNNGTYNVFTLARYTSAGVLDTTFGAGGVITSPIGVTNSSINSIAIAAGGKIVVGGYSSDGNNLNFTVARYRSDGILDCTFGSCGVASHIGVSSSSVSSLVIDSVGKIVAGGYSSDGSNVNFTIARYSASGALDSTFGTGGVVTSTPQTYSSINSIALTSNGKIVAGGLSNPGLGMNSALVRYFGESVALPAFTLSHSTESATVGTSINGYSITSTGGPISSYSISPNISNGLSFDTTTGLIAGTPLSAVSLVTYTITGTNGSGTATATFAITVSTAQVVTPQAPAPTPVPDPIQQSKITSISPTLAPTNTNTLIAINGKFVEKIVTVQVNGVNLPEGSWTQSSTSVTLPLISKSAGNYSIQLYNGSAPVLAEQEIVVSAQKSPTPTASSSVTSASVRPKVIYIHCTKQGHGVRIAYGINPSCPTGFTKQ